MTNECEPALVSITRSKGCPQNGHWIVSDICMINVSAALLFQRWKSLTQLRRNDSDEIALKVQMRPKTNRRAAFTPLELANQKVRPPSLDAPEKMTLKRHECRAPVERLVEVPLFN